MTEGDVFNRAEEFAGVDFSDERLEKRFRRTMETLSKDLRKSIYGGGANRAEAKAIYNLLGNDKFNKGEILRAHRAATIRRMEGRLGVNIHSCLAVTPEGIGAWCAGPDGV